MYSILINTESVECPTFKKLILTETPTDLNNATTVKYAGELVSIAVQDIKDGISQTAPVVDGNDCQWTLSTHALKQYIYFIKPHGDSPLVTIGAAVPTENITLTQSGYWAVHNVIPEKFRPLNLIYVKVQLNSNYKGGMIIRTDGTIQIWTDTYGTFSTGGAPFNIGPWTVTYIC